MDSDKAMSYIIKRVFVWELASECPKVISSFIKYLVESFKNYADFKSINTKELELYNKVYALVFQEIVNLYFTPFLTRLSKQKTHILKDISVQLFLQQTLSQSSFNPERWVQPSNEHCCGRQRPEVRRS